MKESNVVLLGCIAFFLVAAGFDQYGLDKLHSAFGVVYIFLFLYWILGDFDEKD